MEKSWNFVFSGNTVDILNLLINFGRGGGAGSPSGSATSIDPDTDTSQGPDPDDKRWSRMANV